MKDYSNGEYPIIKEYFEKTSPKYKLLVDVGANKVANNSYNLIYEQNWQGILIEPTPECILSLNQTYKGKSVEILQFAISDYVGEAKFYLHPQSTCLNTLNVHPGNPWYSGLKVEELKTINVNVRPLAYILSDRKIPLDFDLLKIDSEGLDYKILTDFMNNSCYRPRYLIREIQGPGPEEFQKMLGKFGYTLYKKTTGNQHFVRE